MNRLEMRSPPRISPGGLTGRADGWNLVGPESGGVKRWWLAVVADTHVAGRDWLNSDSISKRYV